VAFALAFGVMQYCRVGEPDQFSEFGKLDPARVAVVLVDFQNDFCRSSVLGQDPGQTRANAEAARRANVFAGEAAGLGVRVIYTQQVMDQARLTPRQRRQEKDSRLCLAGSAGADLFARPVAGSRIARKYRYDIWQSPEFLAALADWDIDGLVIGGVELTCCVLYAVLGAEERGFHYVVPMDLVSGIRSSEPVANGAARDYLRSVHPHVERADDVLRYWRVG
jgi:nicotinamidase-related amidase